MDSDSASAFNNAHSIPSNFLDSTGRLPTGNPTHEFDLCNISSIIPEFDHPISVPFADRPPIPPLAFGSTLPSITFPLPPGLDTDKSTFTNALNASNSADDSSLAASSSQLPISDLRIAKKRSTTTSVARTPSGPIRKTKNSKQQQKKFDIAPKSTDTIDNDIDEDDDDNDNDNDNDNENDNDNDNDLNSSKDGLPPSTAARGNVSHTRRCRAKVNNYFDLLMEVLPPPPPGVEVKHKAQMLNYAIERFHIVRQRNMQLEMQLALSSPRHMQRWVHSVVSSSGGILSEALKPFMAMICLMKKWKYAELWAPRVQNSSSSSTVNSDFITSNKNMKRHRHSEYLQNSRHHNHHPVLRYVTGAVPPTVQGDELERVKEYRSKSRRFIFRPRSGVPGRVFLTMRPEWLPLLNDPIAFPRAPHAVRNKVEITFAVPVIVGGSVKMVVQFYDLNRRDYDPGTLNMAHEVAEMFGKAFTGLSR